MRIGDESFAFAVVMGERLTSEGTDFTPVTIEVIVDREVIAGGEFDDVAARVGDQLSYFVARKNVRHAGVLLGMTPEELISRADRYFEKSPGPSLESEIEERAVDALWQYRLSNCCEDGWLDVHLLAIRIDAATEMLLWKPEGRGVGRTVKIEANHFSSVLVETFGFIRTQLSED